ncbi:MAG: hypothetical protein CMJ32_06275 [Phycisphaerae bacterium]|nr:hypothetical protein [Phycisphaerae bacterium]
MEQSQPLIRTIDPASRIAPWRMFGRAGWIIPSLITVSLICNIMALTLPFLEIRQVLKQTVIYSLPHSVALLFEHGLWLIAVLVLGFSIIFPLVKIGMLYAIWFAPMTMSRRIRIEHVLKYLGKWSMMDIFVVGVLLVLSNQQTFVGAELHMGVYFFIAAIMISMGTSEAVSTMLDLRPELAKLPNDFKIVVCPMKTFGPKAWIVPFILLLSLIALAYAIAHDFLKINQALLNTRAYSILTATKIMFLDKSIYGIGACFGLFLIVTPLLRIATLAFTWFSTSTVRGYRRLLHISASLGRWSMLDVFGLALILIMSEGKEFIKTDVQSGLYFMVLAIIINLVVTGVIHMVAYGDVTKTRKRTRKLL